MHSSPLLFKASQRRPGGVLHIPEPHQVVHFLLKCMTEKQVGIDVELARVVSRGGDTMTDCGTLVRLHNIAEEFGVYRAMKMIRNILPAHAASNPQLALGFALRDSPINRTLAYQALVNFDEKIATACDLRYWAAIGRSRLEVPGITMQNAMSWARTLHSAFMLASRTLAACGCKPWDADYWQRVAVHFLSAMGDGR